ncbi:MAG: hypothetical protein COY85_01275 [Candidatus Portnoybacteria bacterium CG_4_10_14_0_8_um_filter_40_50]|uniref:Peptidase A2 domain-containing protein n=1 Tax=Candidatus Portnoybacteria bacterium CG_4_10_14_0_8_um_filter_40_50 TaxID=1974800 RepID=A0A2M7QSU0_9BACT|nr:MAG: hypothetical protein COY85_01275 [Candidatus Portnoybacteria bacterium CG_4_10_14_0_8_um_filter_40_50]
MKKSIVTIEVFGPKDSKTFDALVDSGADCSLFNIQIAEALGIDLSKAKPARFTGISGQIDGHRLEKIKIKVDGLDNPVEIPICFVESPTVSLLLGQEGFFDKYRIKFEKDHDTFEIIPVGK